MVNVELETSLSPTDMETFDEDSKFGFRHVEFGEM